MNHFAAFFTLAVARSTASFVLAAEPPVIATMDEMRFAPTQEKAKAELVDGKFGKAIRFDFDENTQASFFTSNIRGTSDWNKAEGFSFWVKGNGSKEPAGLQFIFNDDYSLRYDYAFPVHQKNWTKIMVAWDDLVPVKPGVNSIPLDVAGENKPSRLSALWFGKWWYWREFPAQSFAIDDIRLEPTVERDRKDYRPSGAPLAQVIQKLNAGKPITVVTMGDSLTDVRHWSNRKTVWPNLLAERIKQKYGSPVKVVNPAVGGSQLRHGVILIPRWTDDTPQPDLVTIFFGGNDWDDGMRGPQFQETLVDAVERIRWVTKGHADVLIITTNPSANRWTETAELAEACRQAAKAANAGLADTDKTFHEAGRDDRNQFFVDDLVHLSAEGHQLVTATVLSALATEDN